MTELERDEPAADKQYTLREGVHPHEFGAVGEVFGTWNIHRAGLGASSDQDMVGLKPPLALDFDRVFASELRRPVKRGDAVSVETALDLLGHSVGKGLGEGDEIRPVDREIIRFNTLALHQASTIDDFSASPQHLLGVAAAQRAGAAIGKFVNHCDRPTSSGAFVRGIHRRHSDAEYDKIEAAFPHVIDLRSIQRLCHWHALLELAGKALCRTNRRHSSRLHWVSASFRSSCSRRKTSMRRSA